MTDLTRAHQQPQEIPFGYCHCGCGQKTTVAKWDDVRHGHVKGQPKRFILGHHYRKNTPAPPANPSGLCLCGCGRPAPISKVTRLKDGFVKGQPLKFIKGHGSHPNNYRTLDGPNPSGLCMCGCGLPAPIAGYTDAATGSVKGKPVRFIHNHHHAVGPTIEERFWAFVDKRGPDDCWVWAGSRNEAGYGKFGVEGEAGYAHRVSFELHHGPVPVGMEVCHSCDNPPCVNPKHLFAGTHTDNMQDMVAKGRHPNQRREPVDIEAMEALRAAGYAYQAIADARRLSLSAVYKVARELGWREKYGARKNRGRARYEGRRG